MAETGWSNWKLEGGAACGGVRAERFVEADIAIGFSRDPQKTISLDLFLLGRLSVVEQSVGLMGRMRWRPLPFAPSLDLAPRVVLSAGATDGEPTGRGGLGAELGLSIAPADVPIRIFSGIEGGFVTAGRQADWRWFAGLSWEFPQGSEEPRHAGAEESTSTSAPLEEPPASPSLPTSEEILTPVLADELARQGDWEGAFLLEQSKLEQDQTASHQSLLFYAIMKEYSRALGNLSELGLEEVRRVMVTLAERGRLQDLAGGIRLFESETGVHLTDVPEEARTNALRVIADMIELIQREDVRERGLLDRETLMRFVQDQYFYPSSRETLPQIDNGFGWFVRTYHQYFFATVGVRLAPDLLNDFHLDLERELKWIE